MQNHSKIKILLVQITNKNFGDSVIAENTRSLIKKAIPFWRSGHYVILDYAIGIEDLAQIPYVDAIIFAGGGLIKFRQENLYRQVSEIIMEAQRHRIPVFLNSVGVEGYDAKDERCLLLQEALNQPCVKMISVRDDIETLKNNYIKNARIRMKEVFDPAIWTAQTFHIQKKKNTGRKCIGLGVARENLFVDYGNPEINGACLIQLWKEIVFLLEQRGYEWVIFTNGLDQDEQFAKRVLEEIGHGTKEQAPVNAMELVQQIAHLDGMIACRMHSNIIAYALEIPSVGLVWNSKMNFFGEKTGYEERYIQSDNLHAENIVNTLEQTINSETHGPSYKQKKCVYQEMKMFVRKYVKRRKKEKNILEIQNHLVATALGGNDFKYKNMNTISQLKDSVDKRYIYLEADVRLTSDEKLVCVNGWGKNTGKMLGKDLWNGEMSFQTFMDSVYYNHFQTCSFEQCINEFAIQSMKYKQISLIIDVGRPKTDTIASFYEQLIKTLKKYKIAENQVIIRMQRKLDVKEFEKQKFACQIAYYLPEISAEGREQSEKERDKIFAFCKKKKISLLSMNEKVWSKELQKELNEMGFQSLVFSYYKTGDILAAIREGAELVASHYYSVNYIEQLLK